MLPYSPYPAQRARQIAADAAGILAVVAVVIVTSAVVAAIRAVAELGRQLEAAGGSISEGLSAAGERLGGIPLIGDAVSRPFDAAAGAGDSVSDAGAAVIDALGRVHPDPGSALLAGDRSTIRALAELELRRLGVASDLLP